MRLEDGVLSIRRELSTLDRLVIEFLDVLESSGVKYVIVSGYLAILTGRSRTTEDIDIIIEELSGEGVEELTESLERNGYWCINADLEDVHDLLASGIAARFAREGEMVPNFETKFPKSALDRIALRESMRAELGDASIPIVPLEQQIAYKLYLGADKDLEDALHLYELFGEKLDEGDLNRYLEKLEVKEEFDELVGG